MFNPKKVLPPFGARLREFRKRAQLSQSSLAELVYTSAQTMSHYELGNSRPEDRTSVYLLVRALVERGGIVNAEEADDLLSRAEFAPLTGIEKSLLFGQAYATEQTSTPLPFDFVGTRPVTTDQYTGLEDYFTDREEIQQQFIDMLHAALPTKRLLVIHGIGGIGKSSLLAVFQRYCREHTIGVGFASGDSAHSALEVLWGWNHRLTNGGIELVAFNQAALAYWKVQEAVSIHLQNLPGATHQIGTAMVGNSVLDAWLRTFLSPKETQLVLEPTSVLTDAFLRDMQRLAAEQRIVLMVDTYEKMQSLDTWLCDVVRQLPNQVNMVIAGREMVEWHARWAGWLAQTRFCSLEPLSEEYTGRLIERYFHTQIGSELPSEQAEQILHFSKGLPLAVTTAVRLWVKYGVKEFAVVKADVLYELVKHLRQGVAPSFVPVLEAAAILRYFNRPLLRAVMQHENVDIVFDELRNFPFVRPDKIGENHVFRIHDRVREFLNRGLQVDDPHRFRALHQRAVDYFEDGEKVTGRNADAEHRLTEHLLHLLQADEAIGLQRLHMTFKRCLDLCWYDLCRSLIDEVASLQLGSPKLAHRLDYYRLALKVAEFSFAHAGTAELESLAKNCALDPETQWEVFLHFAHFQFYTGHRQQAIYYMERSLELLRKTRQSARLEECEIFTRLSEFNRRLNIKRQLLESAVKEAQGLDASYPVYHARGMLGHSYFDCKEYAKAVTIWCESIEIAKLSQNPNWLAEANNRLALGLIAIGDFPEAETTLHRALSLTQRLSSSVSENDRTTWISRHLGVLEYARGNYRQAIAFFRDCLPIYRARRSTNGRLRTEVLLAECEYHAGEFDTIWGKIEELDELAARAISSVGEWAARWYTLCGHLLLARAITQGAYTDAAIERYAVAFDAALQANVFALDDVVERVFWRLASLVAAGGQEQATSVLDALMAEWQSGKSEGKSRRALEQELRADVAELVERQQPSVLEQLASARQQGIPRSVPVCWQGL